jgi:hypothetical protein
VAPQALDIAKLLQPKSDAGAPVKVTLTGQPANPQLKLYGLAWLVTDKSIAGLIQIVPPSAAASIGEPGSMPAEFSTRWNEINT